MRTIKDVWRAFERDGSDAGLAALIVVCADDVELRPYAAHGGVLRGKAALRRFWHDLDAAGGWLRVGAYDFDEDGDEVVVTGWVRVSREGGGLSDAQVRWIFTIRDGTILRAVAEPLTSA